MLRRVIALLVITLSVPAWLPAIPIPPSATTAIGSTLIQTSSDPVIAAAGDIACDPSDVNFNSGNGTFDSCRQKYTSDLLVAAGLAGVLLLGDNQYFCGGYQAFLQSYDLSWGRVKSITHPSVGNHEYLTSGGTDCTSANAGAAGYFNYFGVAAGNPSQGYYSFNIGAWHLIALNSNCGDVGGCSPTSPQGQWLEADLAAHSNFCTLAFWHIPLFSSGGRAAPNTQSLWQSLYNHNADIILNGHDHIYERFAPQTPGGTADNVRGIRQFIVGTGGANLTTIPTIAANSEVRNGDTYGVLKLTLHPTSYDWQFVPEAGKTFTDSGTTACHGDVPTSTATPPSPTPLIFSDGFESGNLSQWTSVQGLVAQSQEAATGSYAARGTSAASGATYARKLLSTAQSELYYRIRFKIVSQSANTVNVLKFRTATDASILSVSINNLGRLSYRNDVAGTSVNSTVAVSTGSWQTLQVHVRIAGPASQVEVWHNGTLVSALSRTEALGTNPIGRLQLGENTSGLTYDIAFDDVAAALSFISDGAATNTPTLTDTQAPSISITAPAMGITNHPVVADPV